MIAFVNPTYPSAVTARDKLSQQIRYAEQQERQTPGPRGHATANVQESTDNNRTEYTADISNVEWTAKVDPSIGDLQRRMYPPLACS